jgi:SAM-dependent methyltransferase
MDLTSFPGSDATALPEVTPPQARGQSSLSAARDSLSPMSTDVAVPWTSFWDLSYRDGSYLEHWDPPEIPPELEAAVDAGRFPAGCSVLDLGCGAGREALYLAERGCRVIGLDSSAEALACARALQAERPGGADLDVEWRLGSVYAPPVADASVDVALDRGCLHGIEREDRPRYAAAVRRLLRPRGALLLRGAGADDLGVIGICAGELDELFPPARFDRGPVVPIELRARAGPLPAVMAWIEKRP